MFQMKEVMGKLLSSSLSLQMVEDVVHVFQNTAGIGTLLSLA